MFAKPIMLFQKAGNPLNEEVVTSYPYSALVRASALDTNVTNI